MRRPKIGVFVHLVWATWDRLPLLTPNRQAQAYRAIGAKCQELRADVLAIGGVEDHVHLLVRLPATVAIADLVKNIKGSSGHLLAKQAGPAGASFKWQGAYGAFSVAPRDLDAVADYIAHQRQHHALGTLIPEWEECDEEVPPSA